MEAEFLAGVNKYDWLINYNIKKYCKDENYHADLYQDILYRAWSAFATFKKECGFKHWISVIARNTAIDRLRRIKGKTILTSNIFFDIIDEPYQEISFPVIDWLTDIEKRTLQMRMTGMSYKQISDTTGEPINRLTVRMNRIKKELQKSIK